MKGWQIEAIHGREILDSRGNPTVEAQVTLKNGIRARGCVPSGASTGEFEALELRDENTERYLGKGVQKAVYNINKKIQPLLAGMDVSGNILLDRLMLEEDGTRDKSVLGANAILAVSIACARAAAMAQGVPLYRYLGGAGAVTLPVPLMNILNGGAHSKNSIDIQEFMIVPVGASCFKEALRMGTEVYHNLKKVLENRRLSTAVGDEGGFAPDVETPDAVLELMVEAVQRAGFICGRDICFALDAAASEWKPVKLPDLLESEHRITGQFTYHMPKSGRDYSSDQLIELYRGLIDRYPILSIEDPLDEEDWEGWKRITAELGKRIQLVGDDLFVTNTARLHKGISLGCANSVLIKPNQIGSVSETIETINLAHRFGYTAIASHRSGETEDTTIADLAVALNCGQIKTGAPCRSERVAKYNQLLRIEEELGQAGVYPQMSAFPGLCM